MPSPARGVPLRLVVPLVLPPRLTPALRCTPRSGGRSRARPPMFAASRRAFTNSPRPRRRGGLILQSFLPASHPATEPRPPRRVPHRESGPDGAPLVPRSPSPSVPVSPCGWFGSPLDDECSGKPSHASQVAAMIPPAGMSRANPSASLRACHVSSSPPAKARSVRRQARPGE